ncbi:MAG: SBBP repeat-containing protein, partial [Rivularia sp. (in: cyanobacteria)]
MAQINNLTTPPSPTEVSLAVDSMSVAENSGKSIEYTFTRIGDKSNPLIINFTVGGTATLNTDYTQTGAELNATNGTVTIAAEETTATVTITPIADAEIESDEAVTLTLAPGSNYIFDADTSGMAMSAIANDDLMLNVDWAEEFGGSGYGYGGYEFLAVDDAGNTYVTGDFSGQLTIGDKSLTSSGYSNVFVAKFDEDGNVQWAKGFGDTGSEEVEDITVDGNGNIYFTGTFDNIVTSNNSSVQGGQSSDVFVTKLAANGDELWSKNFGGSSDEEASGIEVDTQGNTYITGEFEGLLELGNTNLDGGQFNDVFVAKLDSTGDVLWAKDFGADSEYDEAEDIVVDKEGNAYLFMTENGESGQENAAVIKLDKSNGSEIWKKNFGDSSNYVVAEDIAIDNQDNIYVTGEFRNTVTFDNISLEGGENGDIFFAKLNSEGDVVWAKDFAQDNDDDVEVEGIAVDEMGNTYVTGYYLDESMSVGDFMLYNENDSSWNSNAFIAKFDSQGEVKWAQNIGGTNRDAISDIAVKDGKIYIAGEFYTEATFGDKTLKTNNFNDSFLVKLEEEKPEISLAVDSTTITEGGNNQLTYTFTRTGELSAVLTVDFTVSGTAIKDDYTLTGADGFDGSKGKVTFKAGEKTAKVTLNITDDTSVEQDETLALNLAMGNGYKVSQTMAMSNITITSDDKEIIIGNVDDEDDKDDENQIPIGNDNNDDDDDDEELSFTSKGKSTFKFKSKFKDGKSKSSIKFSFKSKSIEEIKQIAFFTVDDDEGTIDGISPDNEGYIEAALNRSQTIFSVLGNVPQGFDLTQLDKVLEFSSDTSFRFLSVKNGTVDGVRKGKVKREQVVFSSTDLLEVSEFEKNSFDLDFEGVKIKMKLDGEAKKSIGSGLQDTIEVLDLRELTGKQEVTFTVNREAEFENIVGFYKVTNAEGGIDTDGDGT